MIKKLRVTVDGNTYEVMVELPDDAAAPAVARLPGPAARRQRPSARRPD